MHGIIFVELKAFVEKSYDKQTWIDLLASVGKRPANYGAFRNYPDEEILALIGAAVQKTGLTQAQLLEGFGKHLGPVLAKSRIHLYLSGIHSCPIVHDDWKLLDLLENTQELIHTLVQQVVPECSPAKLQVSRTPHDATIVYDSPRKLCALARGIVLGMAEHYKCTVSITEPKCMLRGDHHCELSVRLNVRAPAPTS